MSQEENKKRKKEFCERLVKKVKEEILEFNNENNLFNSVSLKPYFIELQNNLQKEIFMENKEINNKLTITKLPFEILLNILQFLELNDSLNLNYYLVSKYLNIYLNLEDSVYKFEQDPHFLTAKPLKLLFTKNVLFTKFNVNLQRRIEDDGGGSESDVELKGYYFHNKYPIYFQFNFTSSAYYDVNAYRGDIVWDYDLTIQTEEEGLHEIKVLERPKSDEDENEEDSDYGVIYRVSKEGYDKLREWLKLRDNTQVYNWLVNSFFKQELSFLNFGTGKVDLLDFLYKD
ncbi:hypothetical protein ABK040_006601 [Willaertia magna]